MAEDGYVPTEVPIPVSSFTVFSKTALNIQKFARARSLADFVGVPLYEHGGPNDRLVNTVEILPGLVKTVQDLPDIFADAKKQNDEVAKEILGDKYPQK